MTQAIAQRRTSLPTAEPIETDVLKTWGFYQKFLIFALLHVPLVLIMDTNRYVGTVHAVVTIAVGLYFLRDEKPYRLLYIAAYITGMEVLWRGTGAIIFHEFAKYSISLLLILSMIKQRTMQKIDITPLFYFLM